MISALTLFIYLNAQAQAADSPKRASVKTATAPQPVKKSQGETFQQMWDRRIGEPAEECNVSGSNSMEELMHKTDLADANEYKSPAELDKYISCYSTADTQQYFAKYRDMIEAAAEEFKVEPTLMKCLILRESQWKKDLLSCGCATGVGQQIEDNIDHIGKLVERDRATVKKNPNAKTEYGGPWDRYMNKMKEKNPAWLEGCSGGFSKTNQETDENSSFYKTQLANREKGCKNPTHCNIYHQDDRRCEAASIAANAAYLKTLDALLPRVMKCKKVDWWQLNDSRLALALAYNAGQKPALEALKLSNDGLMSKNILAGAKVSSGKRVEMQNHYDAIFNCMQKGNTKPQAHGDPHKKACFANTTQAGPNGAGGATR